LRRAPRRGLPAVSRPARAHAGPAACTSSMGSTRQIANPRAGHPDRNPDRAGATSASNRSREVDFHRRVSGLQRFSCEMILTPEQARRKNRRGLPGRADQAGPSRVLGGAGGHLECRRRGGAVLPPSMRGRPLIRPSESDLDEIAAILNKSDSITIYAGAGWSGRP